MEEKNNLGRPCSTISDVAKSTGCYWCSSFWVSQSREPNSSTGGSNLFPQTQSCFPEFSGGLDQAAFDHHVGLFPTLCGKLTQQKKSRWPVAGGPQPRSWRKGVCASLGLAGVFLGCSWLRDFFDHWIMTLDVPDLLVRCACCKQTKQLDMWN